MEISRKSSMESVISLPFERLAAGPEIEMLCLHQHAVISQKIQSNINSICS
jgi:hypothetical protein